MHQRFFRYFSSTKVILLFRYVYLFIIPNYFNTRWFFSHNIFSFFVYWIIYTLSWHCFPLTLKPETTIAMHNQNRPCLKNKYNNWTHSVFRCMRRTCLFLFCEISVLLLVSKTHWEKDGFFSVNEWNLEEKGRYILNKILWKIAGKAVFDDLNCKIFFFSQPWYPTRFLSIYQLTDRNFKWPPKSGITWSRWPPGFKMLFPVLGATFEIYFQT